MTHNNSKEYLKELISKLCEQGEDKEELSLWIDLYETLTDDEQSTLISNLEKELKQLTDLK